MLDRGDQLAVGLLAQLGGLGLVLRALDARRPLLDQLVDRQSGGHEQLQLRLVVLPLGPWRAGRQQNER